MQVDPAGLVGAAQRLTAALAGTPGGQPVHPPLGADPASVGAAARLSGAGAQLAALLADQVAGLTATAEQLGLTGLGFAGVDEANAALIAALDGREPAASLPGGVAPAAPPVPADVRAPLPPVPAASGETLSAAVHGGDPAAGEGFAGSWRQVSAAANDAAATVRSVLARLPDVLDSPRAAAAVAAHLQGYAEGFASAGRRAALLSDQAGEHAAQRVAAGRDIPTPEQFARSRSLVEQIAVANARSGGRYAVPLAQAEAAHRALDGNAVQAYASYHAATDATTGADPATDPAAAGPGVPGSEPGAGGATAADAASAASAPGDPATADPPTGGGAAGDGGLGALAGQPGALAQLLPSMIPAVLGAAGGLLGGLVSSVTALPQAAAQAGTQAVSAATTALSGALAPTLAGTRSGGGGPALGADPAPGGVGDLGGTGGGADGLGDPGGAGAAGMGDGGATTPAAGGLAPVTLAPVAAPSAPTLPAGGASVEGGGAGGGAAPAMMPMGMPLGGGGAAAGAKNEPEKSKKVVAQEIPHTEAVTGKITGDRVAISAIASAELRGDPRVEGAVVKRIASAARGEDPS